MKFKRSPLCLASFAFATWLGFPNVSLNATTIYELASEFSLSLNPNGVWSYEQNSVPVNAPLFNGYGAGWGYGAISDAYILQVLTPLGGSHDWEIGDIVLHAPSVPYGGPAVYLDIKWTSPGDGLISVQGAAWGAYFYPNRDATWSLSLNGTMLASRAGAVGLYRSDSAAQFDSNLAAGQSLTDIPVKKGDSLEFSVATVTYFGHFVGVRETISFTAAVPDASPSGMLLAMGLGGIALCHCRFRTS